jgi:diguanylate cyclase (GGDEF)-like protein
MTIERLLVVDDQENVRELLRRVCEREGYDVALAANGQEAIEQLRRGAFALAIVDLLLPDIDGLEVLRQARGLDPHLLVIILTGHADFDTAVEAIRLGAYDYIQKEALSLQLIPIVIQRALDRRRLNLRNRQLILDLQRANAELAQQRAQQLRSIQQMGDALAGRLQWQDTAQVMLQAAFDSVACDAAGILLVAPDIPRKPLAMMGGRAGLAPETQNALLDILLDQAPSELRVEPAGIEQQVLMPEVDAPSHAPWRQIEVAPLATSERPLGVMALVSHSETPFDQDARDILHILVSQGSIALENGFLFARMRELATRDSLTGLYNRSHFFKALETEISRSERHGSELAVIMVDMDRQGGLKEINDTYGHQIGDAVLREVGKTLAVSIRLADTVARYGGDEFIVLAPETGKREASALANRLCRRLNQAPIELLGMAFPISVSMGVAVFRPNMGVSVTSLIDLADQALYVAKEQGGNQAFMVDWD